MAHMLLHHPRDFGDAIRMSIHGRHLILTTRDALQVDEVQTFLDEALDHLKRFSEGYKEVSVSDYASKLMHALHGRFDHFQDDYRTLQHNAEVMLKAAQEYCGLIRKEFRHQVAEPLERFQQEIEAILESYPTQGRLQPAR